jgi:hypothetical protein
MKYRLTEFNIIQNAAFKSYGIKNMTYRLKLYVKRIENDYNTI